MTVIDRKSSGGLAVDENVINFFTIFLAIIGFVFLIAKVVSFVRLVFSLFIFPALPVRTDLFSFSLSFLLVIFNYLCSLLTIFIPVAQFRPTLVLGDCHRRF